MTEYIVALDHIGIDDIDRVGGKNASLGELIGALTRLGVKVPGGFATTARGGLIGGERADACRFKEGRCR